MTPASVDDVGGLIVFKPGYLEHYLRPLPKIRSCINPLENNKLYKNWLFGGKSHWQ